MSVPRIHTVNAPPDRLLLTIVIAGIALRLWQWLADGSLWLDEISIARNIESQSLGELVTRPLLFDQVAPPGFLAVVKLLTMLFGETERILWLFPLVVGIASVVLFRRLAEKVLRGLAVPIAVALFAIAAPLIRYSAEVKQYGIDAAATVVVVLIALGLRERDRSTADLVLLGLAGLAISLFSHASVIVMAGAGIALATAWIIDRDRRTLRALLITMPFWAAAAVMAIVIGERSMTTSTRAFMHDFWRAGFLPRPATLETSALWLWKRVVVLFGDVWTLKYPLAPFFAALALFGLGVLWTQRRDVALIVAGPIALTIAAAMVRKYPFHQRLVVFLIPAALIVAAAGAGWVADRIGRTSAIAGAAVAVMTLIPPLIVPIRAGFPIRVDHYHPVYRHLQANRQPGDLLYVSFLGRNSAIYYGPRYGVRRGDYHVGACKRDDTRAYLRDVDRFRGHARVWFLWRLGPAYVVPLAATRRYLDTIGIRRDTLVVPSGVHTPITLDLYDLSDPVRLRSASAETFDAPPMPDDPKPGCRDWSGDERQVARP